MADDGHDLVVTVGASRAEDWRAWHRQMVITGEQTAERNGALVFMAPDFRNELSRIELRNVGIARLAATGARIVLFTAYDPGGPDASGPFGAFRGRFAIYNELVRQVADRHGVTLVDSAGCAN